MCGILRQCVRDYMIGQLPGGPHLGMISSWAYTLFIFYDNQIIFANFWRFSESSRDVWRFFEISGDFSETPKEFQKVSNSL